MERQHVKKALATLLLIIPFFFTACGGRSSALFLGSGAGLGSTFGSNTNNTNNNGSVDISQIAGSGTDTAQQDAFFERCSKLGDVSFKIAEYCGPLVNSLYNPDVSDQAVRQQFRSQIGNCYQAFQVMYEPYCYNDLQQRIQNGINVCISAFKNAPWETIADEVNNWDTVYRQANDCANGLKKL